MLRNISEYPVSMFFSKNHCGLTLGKSRNIWYKNLVISENIPDYSWIFLKYLVLYGFLKNISCMSTRMSILRETIDGCVMHTIWSHSLQIDAPCCICTTILVTWRQTSQEEQNYFSTMHQHNYVFFPVFSPNKQYNSVFYR